MRAELTRVLPDVRTLRGSAEQIPLPDASVDAVLVAQAWHWVDVARAVPEIGRVLVPGGRLGLLWNIRNERVAWVARLGALMHRGREQHLGSADPQIGPPFGAVERLDVPWRQRLSRAAVLDLVASRSDVIALPPEDRAALLAEVRDLLDSHPQDELDLPYVTRCSRADLAPG
jgi:SAM-dependent methyltransferase